MGIWVVGSNECHESKTPEGAFCLLNDRNHFHFEIYKGLVVELREWNELEDSDFYALVWDPEEKELFRYQYATTRFGSSSLDHLTTADAPEEIVKEARAWQAYMRRRDVVLEKKERWQFHKNHSKEMGISFSQNSKLKKSMDSKDYWNVVDLLCTYRRGKMRSAFKISLAERVLKWLANPAPKYKSPLSWKQLEAIQTFAQKMGWDKGRSFNYAAYVARCHKPY